MRMRELASGRGWRVREMICEAGPADGAAEEQHERVTVAAVLGGSFRYRSTHGAALLAPGALLLGNAGACFTCGHEHVRGDRCVAFQLAPSWLAAVAAGIPGVRRDGFTMHALPPGRAIAPLVATAEHGPVDALAWEELAVRIAGAALSLTQDARVRRFSPNDERHVARALRLIEARYAQPLTLDTLAAAAGLSPYHFLRVFRGLLGVTPHQFVLRTRLRHAARRLAQHSATITETAYATGFGDLSTFNAQFRREFGATPRQWRVRACDRGSA